MVNLSVINNYWKGNGIIISFTFIIAISGFFIFLAFSNRQDSNYEKILCSDKDDIYTNIQSIYEIIDDKQFEILSNKILSPQNNNLLSIAYFIQFLSDNNLNCKFANAMKIKHNQLNNLPLDSEWLCPVSGKIFSTPNESNIANVYLQKAIGKCQH